VYIPSVCHLDYLIATSSGMFEGILHWVNKIVIFPVVIPLPQDISRTLRFWSGVCIFDGRETSIPIGGYPSPGLLS